MGEHRWHEPLGEYAAHVLVSSGVFFLIFGAAGIIDFSVRLAEDRISWWLVLVAHIVSIIILTLDVLTFLCFLFKATWKYLESLL